MVKFKGTFLNWVVIAALLTVIIVNLVRGFSKQYFMPSDVLWICAEFVFIIANVLCIYSSFIERIFNVKDIRTITAIISVILCAIVIVLVILASIKSSKEKEIEELTTERIATVTQDFQILIKKKDEIEWQPYDESELRPEIDLIEIDLAELLESKFGARVPLYDNGDSIFFSLPKNMYEIKKEEGKKICAIYRIDGDKKYKLDLPNMFMIKIYKDESRGIIITEDQLKNVKLENMDAYAK